MLDINLPRSKEVLFLLMMSKLQNLKHLKLSHVKHNDRFISSVRFAKVKKLTFHGQFGINAMTIVSLCPNVNTVEIIDAEEIKKPGSPLKQKLKMRENMTLLGQERDSPTAIKIFE